MRMREWAWTGILVGVIKRRKMYTTDWAAVDDQWVYELAMSENIVMAEVDHVCLLYS